jgi:hypothetical protein
MARELSPVPAYAVDPRTGAPQLGSFTGGLPAVDWSRTANPLTRFARHKRWVYVGIATDDVYVGLAVLRMGYVGGAFLYAYDASAQRMLVRRSWTALPSAAYVADQGGRRCRATFLSGSTRVDLAPMRHVRVATRGLELDVELDATRAPPAIGAIAEVAEGRFDATEKRALLAVSGRLRVDGTPRSLRGGLAGYDFTSGLLPRRTRWRWGFALGRDRAGEPFALNLVEGFVGESECALWTCGELVPLAEGRFAFDPSRSEAPWRVTTADDALRLTMTPGEVHRERRELGVLRSSFVQPCGAWSGSIALPGRPPLVVGRALGVTEDQDITW